MNERAGRGSDDCEAVHGILPRRVLWCRADSTEPPIRFEGVDDDPAGDISVP
jgi:hypothetical protein